MGGMTHLMYLETFVYSDCLGRSAPAGECENELEN